MASVATRTAGMRLSARRMASSRILTPACLAHIRGLATPSSSKPVFSQKLDEGPSLDDFIAGDTDGPQKVVLGNTSQ